VAPSGKIRVFGWRADTDVKRERESDKDDLRLIIVADSPTGA
jgi:hypothetical protein